MRKLETDDMFLLSEIIDKMDIRLEAKDKSQAEVGADLMMQLIRKFHKAKNEIKSLIGLLTEQTPEQVGKMSPTEMMNTVKEIMKQDGVLDFFKSRQ